MPAPATPPRYAGPPAVPGYALGEFLGRGSSGLVWAATDEETGEQVALKVVEPRAVEGGSLDREVELGRLLTDLPHLVTVRSRVTLVGGGAALVMRLADAGSLHDVVTVRGALPLGEVVTTVTPLATTLVAVHEAGVVHADVAPSNVLFTGDGRPVLVDLSSAWRVDEGWPDRSRGTPGFAAPEVVGGLPPLPASDVWSLGALVWYARTGGGTPPDWVGDLHWTALAPRARSGDHSDAPTGTRQDVVALLGPELTPLVLRMLADDPDARPTPAEVALLLYRVATPEPVGLVGRHPDPAAAVTTRIRAEAAQTRSRAERRTAEQAREQTERRERRRTRWARWTRWGGSGRRWSARRPPGRGAWVPLAVVAALLVVGAGTVVVLGVTGTRVDVVAARFAPSGSSTGSVSAATPSRAAPSPATRTPTPTPPPPTTPPTTTATATPTATGAAATGTGSADPGADPVAALQGVAAARADALVTADRSALGRAEAEGSPAHAGDLLLLGRLDAQGQRYRGLTFSVRSAQVVGGGAAEVVLRAVVDRSAYEVVTLGASPAVLDRVPAAAGVPLTYRLAGGAAGWRLVEVTAA